MSKKALFAISTLGLGHATRTLPIIRHYLHKNYHLDIVSYGNALNYLKVELQGEKVRFFEHIDYPTLERWSGFTFYIMLIYDLLTSRWRIHREQRFLTKLEKKTDYKFIFADGKYGFHSKKTKSYLLTHQLSFEIPKIFFFSQKLMDFFNQRYFSKFSQVFIPDYENLNANLAGKLSHPKRIKKISYQYIGILSSLFKTSTTITQKPNQDEPIDFLFTISGFLDEHKPSFIKKLMQESKSLPGRKVFILWDTKSKDYYFHDEDNNIEVYAFLAGHEKEKKFHQAKTIISRAGYTTIMDLIELGKPAILFPTPGQSEQRYLAKYLGEKKHFIAGNDTDHLKDLVNKLPTSLPFNPPNQQKTAEALKTIYTTIENS